MTTRLPTIPSRLKIQLISFIFFFLMQLTGTVFAKPVLVLHSNIDAEEIKNESLTRIYGMQKKFWKDGTAIKVYMLPKNSSLHKEFVLHYLHMQPYQLNRLWHRLLYSGTGTIPEVVPTIEELILKIQNTPGAIGYIDQESSKTIESSVIRRIGNDD